MRQYNKMLVEQNYTTAALHEAKALAIKNFVQENFKEKVVDSIPKLAGHFGVSIKIFQQLAKLAFGKSLREQVITLRMEYSIDLLTTTKKTIREIAYLAGYHDPYYFSRAFKKYYKKSPDHLRNDIAE